MRSFVPTSGTTGHDHFFDTFAKFSVMSRRHAGEWLDEIATRAAAQNEQYLEIMVAPDFSHTMQIAKQVGWRDDLAQLRDALLAQGLREDVAVARADRDEAEASRRALEHCGTPEETPACKVTIRYIYHVLRDFPKEQVFAQTLLGFEVGSADPRFVGITYVQPEDNTTSMADYALHMKIDRLPARPLSQGAHQPACRRARARPCAARGPLLPHSPGGRDGPLGAHRARRRRDVRGSPLRFAERDGRETRDGGNQSHQQ